MRGNRALLAHILIYVRFEWIAQHLDLVWILQLSGQMRPVLIHKLRERKPFTLVALQVIELRQPQVAVS